MPENEVDQSKPAAAQEDTEQAQIRPPSRIYLALSRIIYMFLLASLGVATFLTVLTLDFLQIYPFRYKIPEEYRKYVLSRHTMTLFSHQLPEEERYQQLILQEQERFNRLITEGSRDLERRAVSLEESYRALMRTQKEQHQRELEELRKQRETIELEKKNLAKERQDL